MALTIGGLAVDEYTLPPKIIDAHRARSVTYAINGTAHEDRLGNRKTKLQLTFALLPANVHETLRTITNNKTISVSGSVGSRSISGTFRMVEDELPAPILYVGADNKYYCNAFAITLEEV